MSVIVFELVEDAWADHEPKLTSEPDEDTLGSLAPVPLLTPNPYGGEGASVAGLGHGRARNTRSIVPLLLVALMLALAGIVVVGAVWGAKRAYFVGADEQGYVTVYQGVPWDITDGVKLYREIYVSPVRAPQLSAEERGQLFDHDLDSEGVARERIAVFERLLEAP